MWRLALSLDRRMRSCGFDYAVRSTISTILVLIGGFIVMVLEIIGARYLAKDFGSSFYVWTSQIGVILIALAAGYYAGGALADFSRGTSPLGWLLVPAGVLTYFIPRFGDHVINAIIARHPADVEIPALSQKLDPALGSALVFLLPCFGVATLSPFMIRLQAHQTTHVGRKSGGVIAASTLGSIAGVFVSGYLLVDTFPLSMIFRGVGVLTVLLGAACFLVNRLFASRDLQSAPEA